MTIIKKILYIISEGISRVCVQQTWPNNNEHGCWYKNSFTVRKQKEI